MARVRTGLENLLEDGSRRLKGQRVGLLAHQASVDGQLRHTIDLVGSLQSVRLSALFAPEHGLWGAAQDHAQIQSTLDPPTGLRVWSLYGRRREPARAPLSGLDLLVVDLQDVGARYYTFVWTMACFGGLDHRSPQGYRSVR